MKKIYFISIVFMMAFCCEGYGQIASVAKDSLQTKKCAYFFSIQTGALFGDQVTFSSSTIHGVRLGKKLRLGAGVGFDSFEDAQTLPLFGSASWDLFGKKNVVFVQMNYGYAPFAWSPSLKDTYGFGEIKGGETFSAMLGYRISYGDIRLALLAGYRHQEVEMNYENIYYYYYLSSYILPGGYPGNAQTIDKSMNRFAVSLSMGWR